MVLFLPQATRLQGGVQKLLKGWVQMSGKLGGKLPAEPLYKYHVHLEHILFYLTQLVVLGLLPACCLPLELTRKLV
jgi:hypothetical protein